MPIPTHLLERAYQLINANQLKNAELLLDAVVRVEPQNVDAWETYLMIYQSQNDLDWLKERILKTKELSEANKTKLINYHLYLTKHLSGAEEVSVQINSFNPLPQEETAGITIDQEKAIQFELIDVFDYPTKLAKYEIHPRPRRKSRRRAIYNPFPFDMAGDVFKAILRSSFGEQITVRIKKMITLVDDLIKNPKDTYERFSKSPHFEKYTEIALLALFFLSVRLFISNHFLGYIFLGMFLFGGRWWLLNFGNRSTATLSLQSRIYLHENKNKLPVIKELEIDQRSKSDKENFEETIK